MNLRLPRRSPACLSPASPTSRRLQVARAGRGSEANRSSPASQTSSSRVGTGFRPLCPGAEAHWRAGLLKEETRDAKGGSPMSSGSTHFVLGSPEGRERPHLPPTRSCPRFYGKGGAGYLQTPSLPPLLPPATSRLGLSGFRGSLGRH